MKLERFEVAGLAHYSYILASDGQAAVVDPRRDFDVYLDYAREKRLRITHVLETHIHADYASGALELAQAAGAELWLSAHDTGEDFEYRFPHKEARDGDVLQLGQVRIKAIHTPGHTPEHISFLVSENDQCPLALLSGDFVFVGSLGRPDLMGEAAKVKLAEQLYESVERRIASLPDGVEVHPAHGAGSLCGAGMSDRPQSTLGYERACNRFFHQRSKAEFVDLILGAVPPFPEYYKRMKRVNSEGPRLLRGIPGGEALAPSVFRETLERAGAVVIDLRRPEAFGGAHIPGAFNIGADHRMSMWAAWTVPYDRPIVLVGDAASDLEYARRSLIRVGLDEIRGCLEGGMAAWIEAGYPQSHLPQASVSELQAALGKGAYLLDVRTDGEWASGRIEGAHHLMAGYLPERLEQVPRDRSVYVICGSGYRSSLATSLLRRAGFRDVVNVVGGMNAWKATGLPLETETAEPQMAR